MRVVAGGARYGALVVEGQDITDLSLRSDVHRVGHPVRHGVAVPAQAHDILDEEPSRSYRLRVVAMEAARRLLHESMRVPGA